MVESIGILGALLNGNPDYLRLIPVRRTLAFDH